MSRLPGLVLATALVWASCSQTHSSEIYDVIKSGDTTTLAALLDAGWKPEVLDSRAKGGSSPLHWAVAFRSFDAARLLIDAEADVNATTDNGYTPLHWASVGESTKMVRLLVNHGADVNAVGRDGATPLHGAARKGRLAIAKTLVAAGADPNLPTHKGTLPADLAKGDAMKAFFAQIGGGGSVTRTVKLVVTQKQGADGIVYTVQDTATGATIGQNLTEREMLLMFPHAAHHTTPKTNRAAVDHYVGGADSQSDRTTAFGLSPKAPQPRKSAPASRTLSDIENMSTAEEDRDTLRQDSPILLKPDVQRLAISAGLARMSGDTTYRIGGNVALANGRTTRLRFPISELKFPLDVILGKIEANARVTKKLSARLVVSKSLTENAGKIQDSDWGAFYLDGLPALGPDSLDIYSESDADLDATMVGISLRYRLVDRARSRLSVGAGYLHQQLTYDVSNLDQWYPSLQRPPFYYFKHEYAAGKIGEYEVTYSIPYLEVAGQYQIANRLKVEGVISLAPRVTAEDYDNHILRGKISEGTADGNAVMTALKAHMDFSKNRYIEISIEHVRISTEGTEDQAQSGVFFARVDDEIESNQTQATIAAGMRF